MCHCRVMRVMRVMCHANRLPFTSYHSGVFWSFTAASDHFMIMAHEMVWKAWIASALAASCQIA